MKKVLVLGGSGFVGKALIAELRKRYNIRCLVRDSTAEENLAVLRGVGVELAICNELSAEVFEKALSGVTIAIYLVGIIKETKDNKFERAHYGYVQELLQACKKKKGVKKIVYFSALGVESRATPYFLTKLKAEESIKRSGLHYIIFRPSIMFGQGDKSINTFIRMIRALPLVPCLKTAKMQPVFVGDVAKCARLSLQKPWNKTYELGGKDKLNLDEIFSLIIRAMQLLRIKLKIPLFLIKGIAWLPNPFLTCDQLKMLETENTTSFNAEKAFGFTLLRFSDYLMGLR